MSIEKKYRKKPHYLITELEAELPFSTLLSPPWFYHPSLLPALKVLRLQNTKLMTHLSLIQSELVKASGQGLSLPHVGITVFKNPPTTKCVLILW